MKRFFYILVLFIASTINVSAKDQYHEAVLLNFSKEIEKIAADLSHLMQDKRNFEHLIAITLASKTNEIRLIDGLNACAALANKRTDIRQASRDVVDVFSLASRVNDMQNLMKQNGFWPYLILSLPVPEHRTLIKTSHDFYVTYIPFTDESQYDSVNGFSKTGLVKLKTDSPPKVPTFVIKPAENEFIDPPYPLKTTLSPLKELAHEEINSEYVGIPSILITDDDDGWLGGDPEVYVRIMRYLPKPGGGFEVITTVVDLPGVNKKNVWYRLGDPNETYKSVGGNNISGYNILIGERDSSIDDTLGYISQNWQELPFDGYTERVSDKVKLMLDRD